MLRENTVFAKKIIDFYTEKGVECSVVDEHLSLLVTISGEGRTHDFRYGNRAFGAMHHCRNFYMVLDRELAKLKGAPAAAVAAAKRRYMAKDPEENTAQELSAGT